MSIYDVFQTLYSCNSSYESTKQSYGFFLTFQKYSSRSKLKHIMIQDTVHNYELITPNNIRVYKKICRGILWVFPNATYYNIDKAVWYRYKYQK